MNLKKVPSVAAERVHFVSLGCPKNWVDSEVMLGYLNRCGYHPVPCPDEADLIVVNTCAFIQEAKEEALETIMEMARWKEIGPCRWLVVTGCLPQRYGGELVELLPEVDLMLGPGEIPRIVERLRGMEAGGTRACHRAAPSYLYDSADPRILALPGPTAYVKIAEGCSNHCAYCAVHMIRGELRSRTVGSIIREVHELARQGVKEVILVAQDTTAFGLDRSAAGELPFLLRELDQVDGIAWIRLMYAHPARVTDELIRVLAEAKHICHYLDLPIQHIDAQILRRMKRSTGPESIRRVIRNLRETVPEIQLRTSVIVGFPGETDGAFGELLDFVRETRFEWLGAFAYSREEETPAASLEPAVPAAVARRRLRLLMDAQRSITRESLERWVDTDLPVLVEGGGDSQRTAWGRTPFQAPEIDGVVHVFGEGIVPGLIQRVRITEVRDYDLVGEVLHGS